MKFNLIEIPRFVRVIKLFENKNTKPLRKDVKKTFVNLPMRKVRYPHYEKIEEFCVKSNILKINKKSLYCTELGNKIFKATNNEFSLDNDTKEIFAENCFLKGYYSEQILPILAKFKRNEDGQLWFFTKKVVTLFSNFEFLSLLYECDLLQDLDDKIVINEKYSVTLHDKLKKIIKKKPRITQAQLDKDLEKERRDKKKVGEIAENIVLEFEKKRLGKDGHPEEVRRISQKYANAGYDIESPDRLIEVKGSTGDKFDIFWSQNEIETARENRDKYWIYFVPGVDIKSKKSKKEPILIPDPITNILDSDQYKEKKETLHLIKNNSEEN